MIIRLYFPFSIIGKISSKISIIDIDIDSGNIDDLIVRLYEEYKI